MGGETFLGQDRAPVVAGVMPPAPGDALGFTIMGVPRSGTTALVRAANLHPRVFCTNEWAIGPRAADPGFALPELYFRPERFGISRKLNPEEAEALRAKLAASGSLVYGDKTPRYYLDFEPTRAALPRARHTALYRSPYAFAMSWDRRARDDEDHRWKRGQTGLFSFVEWLLFLDSVAVFADHLRIVAFDRMFFGSAGFFAEWLAWAAGTPAGAQAVAGFEAGLLDAVPPDAERKADCPYAALLDEAGVAELDALFDRVAWTGAPALAAPLNAYLDASAQRLAEGVARRAIEAGGQVLAHGKWQAAQCLRYRLNAPQRNEALLGALRYLDAELTEASRAASPVQGASQPATPPVNLVKELRRLLLAEPGPAETQAILDRVTAGAPRRAIYAGIGIALANPGQAGIAERLSLLTEAAGPAATEREHVILAYLRERGAGPAARLRDLAGELADPHALSWALFLEAELRFHAGEAPRAQPSRIVQFWDADPPPDVAATMDAWRDLVGADRYCRYDDESGRELLSAVAGTEGRRAYDACWHPAMRSDLVRLAALQAGGGLWLDSDNAPLPGRVLPALGATLHLSFAVDATPRFSNDIMAAAPGHPLLAEVLGHVIRNVLVRRMEAPNAATGPIAMTEVIRARGLGDGATALALPAARATVARVWAPSYKAGRTDPRSWQVALRQRQGA